MGRQAYTEVFGTQDIDSATNRFELYFGAPEGERFSDFERRCRAFWEGLYGDSLVITRGITLRILRGIWLGLPPEAMLDLPVGQGCVCHLHGGGSIAWSACQ